jgi:hypothetical protein
MMIASAVLFLTLVGNQPPQSPPEFRYRDPEEDWAQDPFGESKKTYFAHHGPFPCEKIPQYADDLDVTAIYWAIRDAGIFKDRSCMPYLKKAESIKHDLVDTAILFYRYRLGDKSQLAPLLRQFDDLGQDPGDSLLIELFGFLPDWEKTGRRLARATAHSDGHGAEVLSAAFEWKRFLYGKSPGFSSTCRKVAVEEHVDEVWVPDMCGKR